MSPIEPRRKKNPRKSAVAVRYDRNTMSAPQVVAKGRGVIAERLISLARQSGVPIIEDRLLVETLERLNVSQEIPVEMYKVVAEILVAVYKTETGVKNRNGLK